MEYNQEMLVLLTEGIDWEESIIRRIEGNAKELVSQSGLSEKNKKILESFIEKIDEESNEHESTLNTWRARFMEAKA